MQLKKGDKYFVWLATPDTKLFLPTKPERKV